MNQKLEKKFEDHSSQFKKLQRIVDWIGNYIEEQTGLELSKELIDSSDSDYNYIFPKKKIYKVKCIRPRTEQSG